MDTIEPRVITLREADEMLAVANSRPIMRGSTHYPPDYSKWFHDPMLYYDNYVRGYYIAGHMQGFIITKVWHDVAPLEKVYSRIMWTKPGNTEKYDNGFPMFTTFMLNDQIAFMESKGYFTAYDVLVAKNWNMYHANKYCRLTEYTRTEIETIAPGQMTKYPLFKKYLHTRPYDTELNIRQFFLPEDKRGNQTS